MSLSKPLPSHPNMKCMDLSWTGWMFTFNIDDSYVLTVLFASQSSVASGLQKSVTREVMLVKLNSPDTKKDAAHVVN